MAVGRNAVSWEARGRSHRLAVQEFRKVAEAGGGQGQHGVGREVRGRIHQRAIQHGGDVGGGVGRHGVGREVRGRSHRPAVQHVLEVGGCVGGDVGRHGVGIEARGRSHLRAVHEILKVGDIWQGTVSTDLGLQEVVLTPCGWDVHGLLAGHLEEHGGVGLAVQRRLLGAARALCPSGLGSAAAGIHGAGCKGHEGEQHGQMACCAALNHHHRRPPSTVVAKGWVSLAPCAQCKSPCA
mmetsp:Transcript_90374/g.292548  ORF Transcript_90374/g.292548 Transcript_90374/m.292548 type:complete len:238 (+) Transcript_90374:261-974(+)